MADQPIRRPYDSLLQAANAHARSLAAGTGVQTAPAPEQMLASSPDDRAGASRGRRRKREGKP